ncbi:MAG: tetratricopeptide repeat protein [Bacteroidia bacterium]|nr:tetratricopeptide repeat protein [Bacteroidia bacterium]
MRLTSLVLLVLACVFITSSCVTQKKKDEKVTKVGKFFHNVTSKYNAYYNANILFEKSLVSLNMQTKDNYTKRLNIFKYVNAADTSAVASDLNSAIEKNTIAITLHRPSVWTDDCYLMIGKSQYLKKLYEDAQNTFEYIVEEYDPEYMKEKEAEINAKAKKKSSKKRKYPSKKKKKKKPSSKKKSKEDPKPEPIIDPSTGEKVKPDAYFLKHRPAHQESRLWLAKAYLEREKYGDAERLLYDLYRNPKTFKDVKAEVVATLAYYELEKREAPIEAIPYLEEAIELATSKDSKARFSFILAQIYQEQGDEAKARELYDQVAKLAPGYEMIFNSKLNLILAGNKNGTATDAETIAALEKMTRDYKNLDYLDQIYFSLSQIALRNSDKTQAIEYLKTAISSNVNNSVQRAEAYLQLANLYFEDEIFVSAKNYYDSTLLDMPITDERYEEVQNYADNLSIIATNIEIINYQDSLLTIAALSPEDKKKLASDILKEKRRQEILANLSAVDDAAASTARVPALNNSSFFAYDLKQLKKSQREFRRRWGDRILEDDWRRSSKVSFSTVEEVQIDESGAIVEEELSDDEIGNVLQDVPSSPEEISAANNKIMNAMFALGKAFRDKLEDNAKCIETLEQLLVEYSDFGEKKEAYYYLYLANNSLNDKVSAQKYYDLILKEFPESTFAQILTDPDYARKVIERETQIRTQYDKAYALFQEDKIKEGCDMVAEAKLLFGEKHTLSAKYALLEAMCKGKQDGKPAYVKALREVIAQYPETDEKLKAEEMLRVLIGARYDPTRKRAGEVDRGLNKNTVFKAEPEKLHYCIVIFRDTEMTLDEAKLKIAEFNKFHFKDLRLRISNLFLDPESKTPIIVIRRFTTQEKAMEYYDTTVAKESSFLGKRVDFEMYPVTQFNYREILRKRSLEGYTEFFRANYLN